MYKFSLFYERGDTSFMLKKPAGVHFLSNNKDCNKILKKKF